MGNLNPCIASIHYDIPLFSGKQHMLSRIAIGDELYPHPEMVEIILRPEPGVEKKVLDLGPLPFVIPRKTSLRFAFVRR